MTTIYIVEMITKPGRREDLIQMCELFKMAPGFLGMRIYKDDKDENKVIFIEEWMSKQKQIDFFNSIPQNKKDKWLDLLLKMPSGKYYQGVTKNNYII